jgi:ABC-type transporter Mla subunit MlaD
MYGDSGVMRKRAAQIREQATDIRAMADQLVAQTEGLAWTGRAADAMRERIRDRAANLRGVAGAHDTAADSLERHLHEVDVLKDQIADTERKADKLMSDARTRVARVDSADDPEDVRRAPDPEDETLNTFAPPPSGHKDWLTVNLPGL